MRFTSRENDPSLSFHICPKLIYMSTTLIENTRNLKTELDVCSRKIFHHGIIFWDSLLLTFNIITIDNNYSSLLFHNIITDYQYQSVLESDEVSSRSISIAFTSKNSTFRSTSAMFAVTRDNYCTNVPFASSLRVSSVSGTTNVFICSSANGPSSSKLKNSKSDM